MNSNQTWLDIAVAALIGTERQSFAPDSAGPVADLIERVPSESAESRLLGAAAAARVMLNAAAIPPDRCDPIIESEPEQLAPASSAAADLLRAIIHNNDWPIAGRLRLVREWIGLAVGANRIVPGACLADLFIIAEKDEPIRRMIILCGERLVGKRGLWLARQNTNWSFALGIGDEDDPAIWETGLPEQRLEYLRRARAQDPAAGRELVEAVWPQENADTRKSFAQVIAESATPEDEGFLESALGDKGKNVRLVAAEGLSRLPNSALSRRMVERAQQFIHADKKLLGGLKLSIDLPDDLDAAAARDGVAFPKKATEQLGVKGTALFTIVSLTPLDHWDSGRKPEEWFAAARKTDWEYALFNGWVRAAITQRNGAWIKAALNQPYKTNTEFKYDDLLAAIPGSELANVLDMMIAESGGGRPVYMVFELMDRPDCRLDANQTKQWLRKLPADYMHTLEMSYDAGVADMLVKTALAIDPNCVDDAAAMIAAMTAKKPEWVKHIQKFQEIHQLRCAMHKEIRP